MSKRKGESFVFDFSEGSDTPIGESHEETLARTATLTAERDKLKAMVVWAVEHRAMPSRSLVGDMIEWSTDFGQCVEMHDGTPDSILAAVERAMAK